LPIDNNDTERDLRRLTIGRKNRMFFGSAAGGEVAETMYTLIASAARHQLDLWAYVDPYPIYRAPRSIWYRRQTGTHS